MSRFRLLIAPPALSLLAAREGDGGDDTAPPTGAAEQRPAESPLPTGTAEHSPAQSPPGEEASSGAAAVDIEDQSGSGDVAVLARVSAPEAGFVVILLDDDDDDDDDVEDDADYRVA